MGLEALVDGFWNSLFSDPVEGGYQNLGSASGIVIGSNPPYSASDFVAFYPKFGTVSEGTVTPCAGLPLVVMNAYIALASASLMQARWCEMWPIAMGLYVAHFCTLYLRCANTMDNNSPISQIVSSGLQKGIEVSASVGPVSSSMQIPDWMQGWGDFGKTEYGSQLITFAKTIGSTPILIL